jgi:hypothetical protein
MAPVSKTTAERGYDAKHKRERAKYQRRMDRGETFTCARCDKPIDPASWDLGHTDDRTAWTGPECVPCNRGAGGRNGAAVANERRQTVTYDW